MAGEKVAVRVAGLGLLPLSARRPLLIQAACLDAFKKERTRVSGELNVVFMRSGRMRRLHRKFMGLGSDTDVMAFGYPRLKGGPARKDQPFGDLYVCVGKAKRQAKELGHGVLEEILTLVAHGTLHLLGYEDSTPHKKARMFRRQEQIVRPLLGRGRCAAPRS